MKRLINSFFLSLKRMTKNLTDMDKFNDMWTQQVQFMKLLQRKRNFPEFPVDLHSKAGQSLVKDISHECADELHEARVHLKNSKKHRATEVTTFERDKYIEELADAQHYLLEIVIASGVTLEEFYDAYMKKGDKNIERINNGY